MSTCSICFNKFTDPKKIDCGHIFCKSCLENLPKLTRNQISCPVCRHHVTIPEGGFGHFKDAILKDDTCGFCLDDEKETEFFCVNCLKYSCGNCKEKHDGLYSSHDIKAKVELKVGSQFRICERHQSYILNYYCVDCCVLLCEKCLLSKHKDHETPEITDFKPIALNELKEKENLLKTRVEKYQKYINDVKQEINKMELSFTKSKSEIDSKVKEINIVTERGEKMKKELELKLSEEKSKMEKIVENTTSQISSLEESMNEIKTLMVSDSDYDVLDALPDKREKMKTSLSHVLPPIVNVISYYHPAGKYQNTLQLLVGSLQFSMGEVTEFQFTFINENLKEDKWTYSPIFKINDIACYIQAKKSSSKYFEAGLVFHLHEQINDFGLPVEHTADVTFIINDERSSNVKEVLTPPLHEIKNPSSIRYRPSTRLSTTVKVKVALGQNRTDS